MDLKTELEEVRIFEEKIGSQLQDQISHCEKLKVELFLAKEKRENSISISMGGNETIIENAKTKPCRSKGNQHQNWELNIVSSKSVGASTIKKIGHISTYCKDTTIKSSQQSKRPKN